MPTLHSRSAIAAAAFVAMTGATISASAADEAFVQKAAMGGVAEVEAGKLAQQKGASDSVKEFGTKMVDDHSKAGDELKQIATSKGMQVPADTDAKHKKAQTVLDQKSGKGFDSAFKAQMLADHKDTIALFQREASSGTDPDLKAFASKTLPDLKEHLRMAQALN